MTPTPTPAGGAREAQIAELAKALYRRQTGSNADGWGSNLIPYVVLHDGTKAKFADFILSPDEPRPPGEYETMPLWQWHCQADAEFITDTLASLDADRPPRGPAGASEVAGVDHLHLIERLTSLKEKWCSGNYPGNRIADQYLELLPEILTALRAAPSGGWREVSPEQQARIAQTAETLANTRPKTFEWSFNWSHHINALMDAGLLPPPPGSAGRG